MLLLQARVRFDKSSSTDVINLSPDLLEGGWNIDILFEEGFH
jgi:hypothetical protein